MAKTLNIGLIGSGFMGQAHADAYHRARMLYRDLPLTPRLYAIADQGADVAEAARERLGFEKSYGDWRQLMKWRWPLSLQASMSTVRNRSP